MEIFNKKYDCIFSMGPYCPTAEAMIKCKLRYFSSPFDWLFGGSFETRINFLSNNFENFLDKEFLKKIGSREEPEKTDIYINKKNDITFMHDFPKDIPLNNSYIEVKKKYDKRIKNLLNRIKKSKHTLILYSDFNEQKSYIDFDSIKELIKKTNEHFNKNTIDILYTYGNKDMEYGNFEISKISENFYCAEVSGKSKDGKNANFKNYTCLFSKIKTKKRLEDYYLKISKTPSRTRVYFLGIKIMSIKRQNF